jgi:hypothetical protein
MTDARTAFNDTLAEITALTHLCDQRPPFWFSRRASKKGAALLSVYGEAGSGWRISSVIAPRCFLAGFSGGSPHRFRDWTIASRSPRAVRHPSRVGRFRGAGHGIAIRNRYRTICARMIAYMLLVPRQIRRAEDSCFSRYLWPCPLRVSASKSSSARPPGKDRFKESLVHLPRWTMVCIGPLRGKSWCAT